MKLPKMSAYSNGQAPCDEERTMYIHWFETLSMDDVSLVGGKNASLGEMIQHLSKANVPIPGGFAVIADAYRLHLATNGIKDEVHALLVDIDGTDIAQLQAKGAYVRRLIAQAPLPPVVAEQVRVAYATMEERYGKDCPVAMRSSATAEDLPEASFAGQQESALNVFGADNIVAEMPRLLASLFTDRAIIYRLQHGFAHDQVAISIGIQKMVRSDRASAGVLFTLDTESGFADTICVNGAWGLGEYVVQGKIDPDEWYLYKPNVKNDRLALLKQRLGKKMRKLVCTAADSALLVDTPTSSQEIRHFCLSDAEVVELGRYAVAIEDYYSARAGHWQPMDIEWAKDGVDGQLYIVQARPETVHAQKQNKLLICEYIIPQDVRRADLTALAEGVAVGNALAAGSVCLVSALDEMSQFKPGQILVTSMTDPDWLPIMKQAAGIVTDRGGRTCHAAIVSRELGIPAIVGTGNATEILIDGDLVTLDCASGVRGTVYEGAIPFIKKETPIETLPEIACSLMINIGNPDEAFRAAMLPSDGVGLARLEFIINSAIAIHPLALVYPERVRDYYDKEKIDRMIADYQSGSDFFVTVLAQEVGTIAAAFYPKPVIVRFSDFKSNEYRQLIGGDCFEPHEENPMLGFRGAARYYHAEYKEAFRLECAAMQKIRNEMGLSNVKLMVPFVRTVDEAREVTKLMATYGLVAGVDDLELYMMCEVPSNALLIELFAEFFDGFSIGSNDLTQCVLAVDRDSALVASVFDEADEAVWKMIEMAVRGAKKKGKKIGICGQAPSDYPAFAQKLVSLGIDSISVVADAAVTTRLALGEQ